MKRIIPFLTLDREGKLADVIGLELPKDPTDLAEVAAAYEDAGADELFLAGHVVPRDLLAERVKHVALSTTIPLSVAAELASVDAVGRLLDAGAARVAIGAAALRDPNFITALARRFGSETVTVRIDALPENEHWRVAASPGGTPTEWDAVTWARVVEVQGGGSLVLSCSKGTCGAPLDLDLVRAVTAIVAIPVLAAGEVGRVEDVFDALMIGDADGVLVGSLLHSGRRTVRSIKAYLTEHGISMK